MDDEMMSTEFYTKSGWNHKVDVGDEVFSSLLAPYLDLNEPIPERIELHGSVATAIEEGWEAYKYITSLVAEPIVIKKRSKRRLTYPQLMALCMIRGVVEELLSQYPIFLRDFQIARILNLPEGWELFVLVDDRSSEEERMIHTKRQEELMSNSLVDIDVLQLLPLAIDRRRLLSPYTVAMDTLSGLWNDPCFSQHQDEVKSIIQQHIEASLIRAYRRRRRDHIAVPDVDWPTLVDELIPLSNGTILDITPYPLSAIPRSVPLSTAIGLSGRLSIEHSNRVTSRLPLFEREPSILNYNGLNDLYDFFLATIPDDVDPRLIGLSPILDEGKDNILRLNIANYGMLLTQTVACMNHLSLTYSTWKGKNSVGGMKTMFEIQATNVDENDFDKVVKTMAMTTPGMNGLRKVVSSLSHHVHCGCTSKKGRSFLVVAQNYLAIHGDEVSPRMKVTTIFN